MYLRKSLKRIIEDFSFWEEGGPALIYGETGTGKEVWAKENTIKEMVRCFERSLILYYIEKGISIKKLQKKIGVKERQFYNILQRHNIKPYKGDELPEEVKT